MHTRQRSDRRRGGAGLFEIFIAWMLGIFLLIDCHGGALRVESPAPGLLAPSGPVELRVAIPARTLAGSAVVTVDGEVVAGVTQQGASLVGVIDGLADGKHALRVEVRVEKKGRSRTLATESAFELATLDRPDLCEVLNQAACALPFPSSRYLEPANTPTGYRVTLPGEALPEFARFDGRTDPLDTSRIRKQDGFSPTAQILMHFPGGLDVEKSDVSRLLPETRTYDPHRSLEADHPTVLIDWDTGERIVHWLENDARATSQARRVTFLRPGKSLTPGHRYIVAVRNLKDAAGAPLEAEPAFAVLRDRRPTTIAGVEARRVGMEETFRRLRQLGVPRRSLILAFDFVVRSDESLTNEMLTMRDLALDWVDAKLDAGEITFTVDSVEPIDPGCGAGGSFWKLARGSFEVPLYLTKDPVAQRAQLGFLTEPLAQNGTYRAPYALAVPCDVFDGAPGALRPMPGIVLGHGLLGNGPNFVAELARARGFDDFDYVATATNWSGLSDLELFAFLAGIFGDIDQFGALPDRLRQGQVATMVLTRMVARGAFNLHPEFQGPNGAGVLDVAAPPRYFGASLGGIMGLMFAALTPDVPKLAIDVGGINFSLLLQRATPFEPFQAVIDLLNPDPLDQALGISLLHEVWVTGDPAAYATHIVQDPLPGTPAKQILMAVALHDQSVPNVGSQLAGGTLGLPIADGSVMRNLAGQEEIAGALDSGYVVYDTGAYDPTDPA
ncbi:MAG TPA: hypothetical protein VNE71_18905, partial [Myxococcota bacterium]|nr:hypothetical protein [Myxococcota bacterium]